MANKKKSGNTKKAARGIKILLAVIIIILVIIIAAAAVLYFMFPNAAHYYLGLGAHTWSDWIITEQPTCESSGLEERTCTVCGQFEMERVPATGHSWGEWTVETAADCGNDGLETRTCSVCGKSETNTLDATGKHTWTDWIVTAEPDCETAGSETRTCTVCGTIELDSVPATGHTWGEWVVNTEATCGTDGLETHTCAVCGKSEAEAIPATGEHQFGEDGICIICGYDSNSATSAYLGHDLYEGDIEDVSTADLSFHFFDLGTKYTGDCILVKCGNTEVLIDAGARAACVSTIEAYIGQYCTDGVLDYVIATHGDQDHIEAFVGSKSGGKYNGLLYDDAFEIGTMIIPGQTTKTTTLYSNFIAGVERV